MEVDPYRASEDRSPGRVVHQAGVVAFRWNGIQPEYCLITSRRSNRWGFPKGSIGRSSTTKVAALREAFDEAGLEGAIIGEPLSQYIFRKRGKYHDVLMYVMQVQKCNEDWKESHERLRKWASLEAARELIDRPRLLRLLLAAAARIATFNPGSLPSLFPELQIGNSQIFSPSIRRT